MWHREAVGRPTRSGRLLVRGQGYMFDFFWIVLSWNLGQKLEKLSVINHLANLGPVV